MTKMCMTYMIRRMCKMSKIRKVTKMTKKNKAVMDKFDVDGGKTAIVVVKGEEVVPYEKTGFSFHKVVNFLGKHALKEAVSGKKKKEKKKKEHQEEAAAAGSGGKEEM